MFGSTKYVDEQVSKLSSELHSAVEEFVTKVLTENKTLKEEVMRLSAKITALESQTSKIESEFREAKVREKRLAYKSSWHLDNKFP